MGDGLGSVAIHVILVMVAIVDYYIRANHSITGKGNHRVYSRVVSL